MTSQLARLRILKDNVRFAAAGCARIGALTLATLLWAMVGMSPSEDELTSAITAHEFVKDVGSSEQDGAPEGRHLTKGAGEGWPG